MPNRILHVYLFKGNNKNTYIHTYIYIYIYYKLVWNKSYKRNLVIIYLFIIYVVEVISMHSYVVIKKKKFTFICHL